jgi:hypothetical protein
MQITRTRRTVDPSGINNLGRRSLRFTGAPVNVRFWHKADIGGPRRKGSS